MNTIAFDTLKASRNLKAAGFSEAQADAIIGTVGDSFTDTVATKADLAAVKAELKQDIAGLKADMFKVAMGVAIAIILANATMTIALIRFLS
ncbi:MAG: DUF1640 domain-containing protein [Dehalococcoidia bacterium]|nr:DUF1640 domain-containing protein [Dehalococcoidia bacterium]